MIAESTRKAAGQVLLAGFPAGNPPELLLNAAKNGELGGFVLFRRNLDAGPDAVAGLCEALIAACPEQAPPWIAVDQEGGRVQRLGPPVLQLPPMRVLGKIDDAGLTHDAGFVLGQQLAALGFNWDFAPVLDVDTNAASPIIGDRSFGADPVLVARHGAAFARGLERAGVAACGKHFPGHGDAALDSHLALPEIRHPRERLQRVELAPFAALANELFAIMTAHIVFDALDPARPATLSRAVIEGVLRRELGFSGLVVSDDLEMKAISANYGVAEAGVEAVAAGCDLLLVCSDPALCLQVRDALAARAERDASFAARLHDAATRSLSARANRRPAPLRGAALAARLDALGGGELEARIARAAR